jgi:hypothetical protein
MAPEGVTMPVKITYSPLLRVRRSAKALKNGEKILDVILAYETALVAAAENGDAPVTAVSGRLKAKFPEDIKAATVRQFVGTAVKAVLQKKGFEVLQTGVRLPRDPVFKTGAVYRRVAESTHADAPVRSVLANLIKGLTLEEKRLLLGLLNRAVGEG